MDSARLILRTGNMATKKTKTGKGKDGGGKKPVWVDEDAHAILKEWALLTRTSMVDAASALVLESLAGPPVASGDTLIGAEETSAAPAATPAPATAPAASPAEAPVATQAPAPAAAAPAPAPAPVVEQAAASVVSTPAPAPAPRKKRTQKPPAPGTIKQHVGGVWLV
jgi:hypothetical protein